MLKSVLYYGLLTEISIITNNCSYLLAAVMTSSETVNKVLLLVL